MKLRQHLNPSTVISCIALFAALGGVAYAAVPKSSVGTQQLRNGAVNTAKLRNGAVTAQKLRRNAVNSAKLRNNSVLAEKIADGAIDSSKLGRGSVRAVALGGGVVTNPKIQNAAVNAAKLANGAVSTEKLAGNAVSAEKLGASAVTPGKIQDGAVSAAKLNAGLLAQLVKDVAYATKTSPSDKSQGKSVVADCPPGKVVIGGGAAIVEGGVDHAIVESGPVLVDGAGKRTAWSAAAVSSQVPVSDWSVTAYAICATL